jgi:hypothetical protein
MPTFPTSMCLSDQYPALYNSFKALIQAQGVNEKFTLRGRTANYRYYYPGDGYKYWIIGALDLMLDEFNRFGSGLHT